MEICPAEALPIVTDPSVTDPSVTDPSETRSADSDPSAATGGASDHGGHEKLSALTFDLDLFGGMTQEEWESANDQLRRGCGWG